jgi:hypothetical protein
MPVSLQMAAASSAGTGAPGLNYLISAALFAYMLYRQRQVRRVNGRMLLPLIALVLGIIAIGKAGVPINVGLLAAVLLGDAVCLGAVRAWTVRVWRGPNGYRRQGTWLTLGLWLAGVAIHQTVDHFAHFPPGSLLLYLGVTWLAQHAVLLLRVRRLEQRADAEVTTAATLAVSEEPGGHARDVR